MSVLKSRRYADWRNGTGIQMSVGRYDYSAGLSGYTGRNRQQERFHLHLQKFQRPSACRDLHCSRNLGRMGEGL
ncbi:hypothetical protein [Klebsiella phage vB_KshKPC-M]|nr:hypothetical protein [Klebsiella phage vB_KshKPC-M]